jgi:hypothetical protein
MIGTLCLLGSRRITVGTYRVSCIGWLNGGAAREMLRLRLPLLFHLSVHRSSVSKPVEGLRSPVRPLRFAQRLYVEFVPRKPFRNIGVAMARATAHPGPCRSFVAVRESANGTKRTFRNAATMSAFEVKADIIQ